MRSLLDVRDEKLADHLDLTTVSIAKARGQPVDRNRVLFPLLAPPAAATDVAG